jgi:putative hemolysin
MAWCPASNSCIQPWAETCNINGDAFSGPSELSCEAGNCSSGDEKCEWSEGSTNMATFYFHDLNGAFEVPEGCTLNCTGCELSTDDDASLVGVPNPASVNCIDMGGTLETKYEPAGEYAVCVFDDGSACEEWTLQRGECEKGSRVVFSTYCANNGGQLVNATLDQGAQYQMCSIGDYDCTESSYYSGECTNEAESGSPMSDAPTPSLAFDDDEYGCGGASTGLAWCPESDSCIQPWDENCFISGGEFLGSTKLVCDEGRCSSGDQKCEWTEGSSTMALFYFHDLNGDFDVPEGCTLNCTGCVLADDETKAKVGTMSDTSASSSIKLCFLIILIEGLFVS